MKQHPFVSVVLPVYNGELFLERAIKSILAQTYPWFELILIDDGSTDSSVRIMNYYRKNDARIRVIRMKHHCGLVECLNRGITESRGKYIARMDADDISLPTRLKKQISWMEAHVDCGLIASRFWVSVVGVLHAGAALPIYDEEIKLSLRYFNPFTHGAVVLRTAVLRKYSLFYRVQDAYFEDYSLWVRMMPYTTFHILEEPLYVWSVSRSGITGQHIHEMKTHMKKIAQTIPFNFSFLEGRPIRDRFFQKLSFYVGRELVRKGEGIRGLALIMKSFFFRPKTYFYALIPFRWRKDRSRLPLEFLFHYR